VVCPRFSPGYLDRVRGLTWLGQIFDDPSDSVRRRILDLAGE